MAAHSPHGLKQGRGPRTRQTPPAHSPPPAPPAPHPPARGALAAGLERRPRPSTAITGTRTAAGGTCAASSSSSRRCAALADPAAPPLPPAFPGPRSAPCSPAGRAHSGPGRRPAGCALVGGAAEAASARGRLGQGPWQEVLRPRPKRRRRRSQSDLAGLKRVCPRLPETDLPVGHWFCSRPGLQRGGVSLAYLRGYVLEDARRVHVRPRGLCRYRPLACRVAAGARRLAGGVASRGIAAPPALAGARAH